MPTTDDFADLKSYAADTFRPSPTSTAQTVRFHNDLKIPIRVTLIKSDGSLTTTSYSVTSGGQSPEHSGFVNDAWLVQAANTSALIDVLTITASPPNAQNARRDPHIYYVPTSNVLNQGPPNPSKDDPYAPESRAHTFLVGQGKNPHNSDETVTREVWWNLNSDSFALAAGESRTWKRTRSDGVERASTVETEFITKLGLEAKGGWEAITTTINASFEGSYKETEQITLKQSESFEDSHALTNSSTSLDKEYHAWQVMEKYTIWKGNKIEADLTNDTGSTHISTVCYKNGKLAPCDETH
ncbi:hypothetical protein [Streptomyces sp. NPDC058572]|uniref:hypothetical protein n=1 Tax=Streptomyces sp. NPDC058572 TaxID=3346546 RepID=UPI00364C7DD8